MKANPKPLPTGQRLRVYVAGPLTQGDRFENVNAAIALGRRMVRDGMAPFVPHLDAFMFPHPDDMTWEVALDWDLSWVKVADAVFRMPGVSPGADLECLRAQEWGIRVFKQYAALLRYSKDGVW